MSRQKLIAIQYICVMYIIFGLSVTADHDSEVVKI